MLLGCPFSIKRGASPLLPGTSAWRAETGWMLGKQQMSSSRSQTPRVAGFDGGGPRGHLCSRREAVSSPQHAVLTPTGTHLFSTRKWSSPRRKLPEGGDVLGGISSLPRASSGSALLPGTSNLAQKGENQAATWLPSSPAARAWGCSTGIQPKKVACLLVGFAQAMGLCPVCGEL